MNIFDKHLGDLGIYLEADPDLRQNRIRRKIASYLYDALYHHNPDEPGKNSMSDVEKVISK